MSRLHHWQHAATRARSMTAATARRRSKIGMLASSRGGSQAVRGGGLLLSEKHQRQQQRLLSCTALPSLPDLFQIFHL